MTPDHLIEDCIRKIMVAMKEGRFSVKQLLLLQLVFLVALDWTQKTIAKARTKQAGDDPTD